MEEQLPTPPASPIDSKASITRVIDFDLVAFQHKAGKVSYPNPPTPSPETQVYSDFMNIDVTSVSSPSSSISPLSTRSPNSTPSPSTAHTIIRSPQSSNESCSSPQVELTRLSRSSHITKASQTIQSTIDNHPIVRHGPFQGRFVFPEDGPEFPYMFGVSFYNILGLPESPLTTTDDVHQAYFDICTCLTSFTSMHP